MKTPEQVAEEALKQAASGHKVNSAAREFVKEVIAAAIEADRKQRKVTLSVPSYSEEGWLAELEQREKDVAVLAEAAVNWADELTEYIIPRAENDEEKHEWIVECDRIDAAYRRYLEGKK